MNKKGLSKVNVLFVIILVSVAFVMFLGSWIFISDQINSAFAGIGQVGQVNFTEAAEDTWGEFDSGLKNSANLMALALMFGLSIGLVITGYLTRGKSPAFFWIIEVFIIIAVYVLAGYVSNFYQDLISIDIWSDLYATNLNGASLFILNLPIISVVVGVITMIITYAGIPRKLEDETFIGAQ